VSVSTFQDSINQTGWATLEVHGNASVDDRTMARAAGFYEGVVTQQRIYETITSLEHMEKKERRKGHGSSAHFYSFCCVFIFYFFFCRLPWG
jgi:hypothetical protein